MKDEWWLEEEGQSQILECYHKNRVPMCKGKW